MKVPRIELVVKTARTEYTDDIGGEEDCEQVCNLILRLEASCGVGLASDPSESMSSESCPLGDTKEYQET